MFYQITEPFCRTPLKPEAPAEFSWTSDAPRPEIHPLRSAVERCRCDAFGPVSGPRTQPSTTCRARRNGGGRVTCPPHEQEDRLEDGEAVTTHHHMPCEVADEYFKNGTQGEAAADKSFSGPAKLPKTRRLHANPAVAHLQPDEFAVRSPRQFHGRPSPGRRLADDRHFVNVCGAGDLVVLRPEAHERGMVLEHCAKAMDIPDGALHDLLAHVKLPTPAHQQDGHERHDQLIGADREAVQSGDAIQPG